MKRIGVWVGALAVMGCADDGGGTGTEGGTMGTSSPTSGSPSTTMSSVTPTGAGTEGQTGDSDGSEGSSSDDGADTTTGPVGPPPECVETVDAANAFLASLDGDQTNDAVYPWEDGERIRFEFLPPNSAARNGLTLRDADDAQEALLATFLQAAMSSAGYTKVEAIRALESVLAMQESGQPVTDNRDPENYFISFFGTPNVDEGSPWGWRFEGHHLSLHGSMVDCDGFAATPAFWGVSPMLDPIQDEVDLAIMLWDSLDAAQQAQADANVAADAVGVKQGLLDVLAVEGVAAGDMDAAQAGILRDLVAEYAENMNAPVAAQRIEAIEAAGFDEVHFTYDSADGNWRVLGPTFVIEFLYEGNTHVHSVWRDYDGDYGEDLIAKHLNQHHHEHAR